MKIRIEFDETTEETEVLIRCRELSEEVKQLQKSVSEIANRKQQFVFYKDDTEYYLSLDDVLFFETDEREINVHTKNDIYQTRHKLYELEEMLPGNFMRVSKSSILNTHHVYSITKNISASSVVQFRNTHKQVYVSRTYYKPLRNKLEEKRVNE